MEGTTIRLGLFQSNIRWENKQVNYRSLENALKESFEQGLDCVFMPEMSFTGFSMSVSNTAEDDNATVNLMSDYSKEFHVALGFGWVSHSVERGYENHYTIVDTAGKVISDYVKCHPFFSEHDIFSPGTELPFCRIKGIGISNVICYDLRFPELFRNMKQDAHVVLVPAQWPASRRDHWMSLLQARAIENQVYIVGINGTGNIGGTYYSGDSCVINPDGIVIYNASESEGLHILELDDDAHGFRDRFPVLKDRRNGFYAELYRGEE